MCVSVYCSLRMCVCLCATCVCMCVCVCVSAISFNLCACLCIVPSKYVCVPLCDMYVCVCVCIYRCWRLKKLLHIHTCLYMYIHIVYTSLFLRACHGCGLVRIRDCDGWVRGVRRQTHTHVHTHVYTFVCVCVCTYSS